MQEFVRRTVSHSLRGYPSWLSSLLHARGVNTQEEAQRFLNPDLSHLHPPLLLQGMREAVEILRPLGKRGARAVVYGDYDVDGLCASVIAKEALEAAGFRCIIYIPDRHTEGYGINAEAVKSLASQAELLLTVDCGITAVEEVRLAKSLGLCVIVTDHHQPPDELPPADAVINPLLGDYPFPNLCGAGTAWKLSLALVGDVFARAQLDLAALATIADMVPLLDENRVIAHFGLHALARTKRLGLRAMMANMGLEEGEALGADRVSFGIAPRLNAGGRLTTAQDALQLLQTDHPALARELALNLNALNAERQDEERRVIKEAEQQLEGVNLLKSRAILLHGVGWNSGVVGLAAGKIAEKYGYPTVVLSQEGDKCTGSGRSAGGIDLYKALSQCAGLFLRFGGHKQAAGLSMQAENTADFRACFNSAVEKQLAGRPLLPQVFYDADIKLADVSLDAIKQLERLAPFGVGNPTPAFLVTDVQAASSRKVGAQGQHLKLQLAQEGHSLDSIGFGMGDMQTGLPPNLHTVLKLSLNSYRGRVTPQGQITALKAGSLAFRADAMGEEDTLMKDLRAIASNDMLGPFPVVQAVAEYPREGALLLCRSWQTATLMHERYPQFACATSSCRDRRAYSTIVYCAALEDLQGPYELLVFCDGTFCSRESAYARELFPEAGIFAAETSEGLLALKARMRPSVEELRELYRHLRSGQLLLSIPWPPNKARLAALILEETGLIRLHGTSHEMLPPERSDPTQSKLYQLIQ